MIKQASIYRVNLPQASALEKHLHEAVFKEVGSHEQQSSGFVPVHGRYALDFTDGVAFRFRLDEKIIPTSSINAELDKRIKKIEDAELRKLSRKERSAMKDDLLFEKMPSVLPKPTVLTCFYRYSDRILIVPTTSIRLSDLVTSSLIKAVGSIKSETIHIDGIKNSITARLMASIGSHDEAGPERDTLDFDEFKVGGVIRLKNDKQQVAFKVDEADLVPNGIKEAVDTGFQVSEIELLADNVRFRLTDEFKFKGIKIDVLPEDTYSEMDAFSADATIQTDAVVSIAKSLMAMFDYKEPEQEQ